MPVTLKDIALGGLAPAAAAAAVMFTWGRARRSEESREFPGAVAFAVGFCLGYALLGLGPWKPTSHWHWLPYVGLIAAAAGPLACTAKSPRMRLVWSVVPALLAAWLLVPDWSDLHPPRAIYVSAFAGFVTVLMGAIAPLASRIPASMFAGTLCATLLAAAILLLLADSLRFAQMAGAAAGSLGGCAVAAYRRPDETHLGGLACACVPVVTGLMLVGHLQSFSRLPWPSYVLILVTPAMLWLACIGPLAELRGARRAVAQTIVLLAPLVIAFSLAALFLLAGEGNA